MFKAHASKAAAMFAAVAAAIFALSTPAVASATTADEATIILSPADEQVARDFFDKFGVDLATQDRLLNEYRAGDSWDAMTSAAVPVSVEQQVSDGVTWTVNTFDDGSVRAEGIGSDSASLSGGVAARGVDGCNYSVGKYGNFSNCHIYAWVGVVQIGFYANFSIVSGGNDKITNVWGGTLFAGGACSQSVPPAQIIKGTESSTGKAIAGLTAQATMCGTMFNVSFPTYLHVGGNRADHVYS